MQEKENVARQLAQAYRDAAPYLNIGWFFIIAILLGVWIGSFVDEKLSSKPYFMLAGAIFGIILGFMNLYKIITLLKKKK